MKRSFIYAISVIFFFGISSSIVHAEDEVSCVPKLTVKIKPNEGYMYYSFDMVIKNTTNETVKGLLYQLMSKGGTRVSGGKVSYFTLKSNKSTTQSTRVDADYAVEWSKDPETRKRQEVQFEKIRQERESKLDGAYCKFVSFATSG